VIGVDVGMRSGEGGGVVLQLVSRRVQAGW
jgi:hypothetical protein